MDEVLIALPNASWLIRPDMPLRHRRRLKLRTFVLVAKSAHRLFGSIALLKAAPGRARHFFAVEIR